MKIKNKSAFKIQYIWIENSLIQNTNMGNDSTERKRKIEALAFAVFIKQRFRNSIYRDINIDDIKKALHIGAIKAKRLIIDIVKYGYAERCNNDIIVGKLKYVKPVKAQLKSKNCKFTPKNTDSLSKIVYKLKCLILLNKIRNLNFQSDTQISCDQLAQGEISKSLKAKRKKYVVGNKNYGVSISELSSKLKIKNRNTLVKILDELILCGMIRKQKREELIYQGSDAKLYYFQMKSLGHSVALRSNGVYRVLANIYTLTNVNYFKFLYTSKEDAVKKRVPKKRNKSKKVSLSLSYLGSHS